VLLNVEKLGSKVLACNDEKLKVFTL